MKIAITGASGHIGSVLSRQLLEQGHEIWALIFNGDDRGIRGLDVERVEGELHDAEAMDQLLNGCEQVYHLAGLISINGSMNGLVEHINIEGTRQVIQAVKRNGVKRMLYYSTLHAMDPYPMDTAIDEKRPLCGGTWVGTAYYQSKASVERIIAEEVNNGLDAVIIAPTSVMGPLDYKPSLLGQSIIDIYEHNIPAVVKGGFDWVDVRDLCIGSIAAMETGRLGEKYILNGEFQTVGGMSRLIAELSGKKTPTTELPLWVAQMGAPFAEFTAKLSGKTTGFTRDGLQAIKHCNPRIDRSKAEKELGYKPRSLRESMKDTLDWFRSEGMIA